MLRLEVGVQRCTDPSPGSAKLITGKFSYRAAAEPRVEAREIQFLNGDRLSVSELCLWHAAFTGPHRGAAGSVGLGTDEAHFVGAEHIAGLVGARVQYLPGARMWRI